MNPSTRIIQVSWRVSVAVFFFLTGALLSAQEQSGRTGVFAWSQGKAVAGLQVSLEVDPEQPGRSEVPTFIVELRNVGKSDFALNLGTMAPDGTLQSPNAISLVLADSHGTSQRLELKPVREIGPAGQRTLFVPLPAGATFSFPVDLRNYWAVGSTGSGFKMRPGTYSLVAQFTGLTGSENFPPFTKEATSWEIPISGAPFDVVNPQMTSIPTSNALQFEVAHP